jgi:hypothetical protein
MDARALSMLRRTPGVSGVSAGMSRLNLGNPGALAADVTPDSDTGADVGGSAVDATVVALALPLIPPTRVVGIGPAGEGPERVSWIEVWSAKVMTGATGEGIGGFRLDGGLRPGEASVLLG